MLEFKKTGIIIIIFLNTIIANAQVDLITGIGASYEFEDDLKGINGRLYYGLDEHFCFGPEVSFFPYQDIEKGIEKSVTDLNINAHYIFELTEKLGFYPLSGINYTIENERYADNRSTEKVSELGINYGLGTHYNLTKNLFIFSEFKGVIGELSDEFITIGVIIDFTK